MKKKNTQIKENNIKNIVKEESIIIILEMYSRKGEN